MILDFTTLHVVALLNTAILMIVFAGILWAYRSFAATRYWLYALALHGAGTILLALGTASGSEAAISFGSWLFGIAYCVAWQGIRVFYGRPPNWRVTVGIAAFSALVVAVLVNQERPAQSIAVAVVQIVSIVLIALAILRHPLRLPGFVVLAGTALAFAGNIAEVYTNLPRAYGMASTEQSYIFLAWFYLAVTVGAGICYIGFLLMAFDRLRAQQQDFVALVSHEFRAPLAVIAAAADNLSLSPAAGANDVRLRAAKIQRTAKRMSRLIDNVLIGDRLDAWQAPYTAKAALDLNEVLSAVEAGADGDAAVRVSFAFGDAAPVRGDRNLLEIAVLNLIQNAMKYSPAGSPVTVRLSTHQALAYVDVADQGTGVPPDDHERIFMKYYRVAGHPMTGSGLGLYIAREIARRHGGDLALLKSDGSGSTFRLSLPLDSAGVR